MTRAELESRLFEYSEAADRGREESLTLLETALFLEETFGLRLCDADITMKNLGTHQAMLRFVEARMNA